MNWLQINSTWLFSNFFSNPLFTAFLGIVGGIVITLSTKLGESYINLLFENIKLKKIRKIQVAKDINTFCIEGMHKAFEVRANSEQNIKLKATEIEAINLEVGTKLREFLDSWSQCRNFIKDKQKVLTLKDELVIKDYKNKAQRLGEELLKTARDWGK